jgi:predicted RND superfamily exporter protein
MALGALFMVILSTGAGFGLSSAFGLFFGPVHSLLPFILLGIGVDDAFVIVNAFNRERKVKRSEENNAAIAKRSASALARAGASITVTSLTDLVAFAISSSSALPALSSFCGYAAICIFFLWFFAATFFSATMVLDERRQRDNRRECLVCVNRKGEAEDEVFEEGFISKYFRNYHAPAILSKPGKIITLIAFAGLLAFGIFGALNLTVEDSERNFLPQDSYIVDFVDSADQYFPDQGVALAFVFEGSSDIYGSRQLLAELETRLEGKSTSPPYIAEPVSEEAYRNVMSGLSQYLAINGTSQIGNVALGEDGWPTTESDFVLTVASYASFIGPGSKYAQDVSFSEDRTQIEAFKVESEYVKLLKKRRGEQIDDAEKLIDAMDSTRDMVDEWNDLPSAFPYSDKFLSIEGFKIIRQELFLNVGLAIIAVGIIVFFTVASFVTAIVITLNVAFCIIEILGFMYAVGIVIDSVSVINIVLAVGLSVDYSAHVGHCFMVKGGTDKNKRALEALADIGAAVLSGATSTFLAVVVLLFSSSYVFATLSKQFALTVVLGVLHGLVLLPVILSIVGPKPFSSAEDPELEKEKTTAPTEDIQKEEGSSQESSKEEEIEMTA